MRRLIPLLLLSGCENNLIAHTITVGVTDSLKGDWLCIGEDPLEEIVTTTWLANT
jgi:hypothetical protein